MRIITGYCPHLKGNHSIEATYTITRLAGGQPPKERCSELRCKYKFFSVCKVEDCPLKEKADSYNS